MKKLVISFGDDVTKKIDDSYTVTSCIMPDGKSCYLLFHESETPLVFYFFSDLVDFFHKTFVL